MGFEVLPERCNRGTVSYMKKEKVPKNWGIVTEGIRKVFDSFVNPTIKSGGLNGLEFMGTSLCIFERGVA